MSTDGNHRGVKRVRQACLNCRRKKARCPGERPRCSFCARLNQQCQYADVAQSALPPGFPTDPDEIRALVSRISTIESKLNSFSGSSDASLYPYIDGLKASSPTSADFASSLQSPRRSSIHSNGHQSADAVVWNSSQDGLPPLGPLSSAIDDFFVYSHNQPYSFFNENNFRQRLADGLLPDYLLFAVLASALRFSTHPFFEGNQSEASRAYARKSWKLLASDFLEGDQDPDVRVVQATTLLGIFDFVEGRHRSAWVKVGFAARIGQDLRLMFEPDPSLSFADQEEHRRGYWSVYLLDSLMTCGRARPPAFHEYCCNVQLPCDEINFRTSVWQKTDTLEYFTSNQRLQGQDPGPYARVIIIVCVLTRCAQYAIQAYNVRSESPPWDSTSDFASIFSTLLYLETRLQLRRPVGEVLMERCTIDGKLDTHSAEPIVFSYQLYHLCHCLLQHHFLLRQRLMSLSVEAPTIFLRRALEQCRDHAQAAVVVLRDARNLGCKTVSSFLGYSTLVAATVHALYQHDDDSSVRQEAYESLQFCKSVIEGHARLFPNAITIANALNEFDLASPSYKGLVSPAVQALDFEPHNLEILYSLVDYSTLSNSTAARPVQNAVSTWSGSNHSSPPWMGGNTYSVGDSSHLGGMQQHQQHQALPDSFFDNLEDIQRVTDFLAGGNVPMGSVGVDQGQNYEPFS